MEKCYPVSRKKCLIISWPPHVLQLVGTIQLGLDGLLAGAAFRLTANEIWLIIGAIVDMGGILGLPSLVNLQLYQYFSSACELRESVANCTEYLAWHTSAWRNRPGFALDPDVFRIAQRELNADVVFRARFARPQCL
jgi:hypothetical protein